MFATAGHKFHGQRCMQEQSSAEYMCCEQDIGSYNRLHTVSSASSTQDASM